MEKLCIVRGEFPKGNVVYVRQLKNGEIRLTKSIKKATLFTGDEAHKIRRSTYMWNGVVINKSTGQLV